MTVHLLPDRLTVPLTWASTFTVDGKLSARDLSYSLAVGWLAAQRDPSEDGKDIFLGDNGLRMALGRSRRGKQDEENGRVFRTVDAKVQTAGIDPVALPSLQVHYTGAGGVRVHRGGIVRDGDRHLQWSVPADVAASMRVSEGDQAVDIPWSILQHARTLTTVPLMLRILAMVAGKYDSAWIIERHGQRLVLLMPYAEVVARLGLPAKSEPKATMRKHLVPAAAEITEHTDYTVTITERRVQYKRGPHAGKEGPLQGLVIYIEYPVIETPVAFPEPRVPYAAWKPRPKFRRPPKPAVPEPAFIDGIDILPVDDDIPVPGPRPTFTAPAGMTSRFGGFGNRNR